MMINSEVTIMALNQERERQLKHHMEETRILQALNQRPIKPARSRRFGALPRAWHALTAMLRGRWVNPGLRRNDREPCATAAD